MNSNLKETIYLYSFLAIMAILSSSMTSLLLESFIGTANAATMQVCFTPGEDCQGLIASQIDKAKSKIYVQAYHLTNKAIITALKQAQYKGVTILLIVDKQAKKEAINLLDEGFNVMIDRKPRIAHNKVMIIDDKTVITGSFNFTAAAQKSNAENVIIIEDSKIAGLYEDNFFKRERLSSGVN